MRKVLPVDIWAVALDGIPLEDTQRLLAAEELERTQRYRFARDAARWSACRAALRLLLGAYAGCDAGAVRFGANAFGKPILTAGSAHPVAFNVSRSNSLALVALARGGSVGVDLEYFRSNVDCLGIARRFFSPCERAALAGLHGRARERAFFECWVRKEAVVKALGGGLAIPLDAFDVSLAEHDEDPLRGSRIPGLTRRCTLHMIDVAAGYAAALAVLDLGAAVRLHRPDETADTLAALSAAVHCSGYATMAS